MRVLYDAGPGNAFEAFRHWAEGAPDDGNSHLGYSWQFFNACRRHGHEALVICTHPKGAPMQAHGIELRRGSDPRQGKSGLGFHRAVRAMAQQRIKEAQVFGADVVIISGETNPHHYRALTRKGVLVVQALHSRLWLERHPPSFMARLRLRGYARAYRSGEVVVFSASDHLTGQVRALSGNRAKPVVQEFLPLYRADFFAGLPLAQKATQVLFLGRVEVNKGVMDLIPIAQGLQSLGIAVCFHICGDGAAMAQLQAGIAAAGLQNHFVLHGWSDRDKIRKVISGCAFSIVPTRSDFIEGFNQVAVESVLAGRPVVASDQCPAVRYLGQAAVSVPADDVPAYVAALAHLIQDPQELARRQAACAKVEGRFYSAEWSYEQLLDQLFTDLAQGVTLKDRVVPI